TLVAHDDLQRLPVVGAPVARLEDVPLVTGRGLFAADVTFPDTLHMRVVRSPVAHGRIVKVDTSAARSAPGVVAVWPIDAIAHLPPVDFLDDRFKSPNPPAPASKAATRDGPRRATPPGLTSRTHPVAVRTFQNHLPT